MKRRRIQPSNDERRGAAMVEMAIVSPLFFMLVLGIIEFGRAFMVGQLMTNASREAVRMAIIPGTNNADVEDFIEQFVTDAVPVNPAEVTIAFEVTHADGSTSTDITLAQPRELIAISVAVPYDKVSYIAPQWLATSNIRSESFMRAE